MMLTHSTNMSLRGVNIAEGYYEPNIPSVSYVENLDTQKEVDKVFEIAMSYPEIRQHIQLTQIIFPWNVLKESQYKKLILPQIKSVKKSTPSKRKH